MVAYVLAEAETRMARTTPKLIMIATVPKFRSRWKHEKSCKMKACRRVSYRCRVGSCLRSSRKSIATKFCRRRSLRGWRLKRAFVRVGIGMLDRSGDVICLDRFGASAPGDVALRELGFNVENVLEHARRLAVKLDRIYKILVRILTNANMRLAQIMVVSRSMNE